MQNLREDNDVSIALGSKGITELSIEKGTELIAYMLPDNIDVSEFSVSDDMICFGYFINGYRVILQLNKDNQIHKTIGVYKKMVILKRSMKIITMEFIKNQKLIN